MGGGLPPVCIDLAPEIVGCRRIPVVLVSSAAVRIGLANHEVIAAAKAGIELATAASHAPKVVVDA